MYIGLLAAARADERRPAAADRGVRRRQPAGRRHRHLRARSSAPTSTRATACPRPRRWPRSTSRSSAANPAPSAGRSGAPMRRSPTRDRGAHRAAAAGRGRRGGAARAQHLRRLPEQPRRHRRGAGGRLVPHRRPGRQGRRRIPVHRRPQEGPDHPRRLQRVPARGRGGARRTPGHRPGRGRRRGRRRPTARRSARSWSARPRVPTWTPTP